MVWARAAIPFVFSILLFTFPPNPSIIPEINAEPIFDDSQIQIDLEKLASTKIPFIENQGQINSDEVKYYAKTFAGTAYVTDEGITYSISGIDKDNSKGVVIKETFLNSNGIIPNGIDKSEALVSYFKGEQENWRSAIPTFNKVSLGTVWDSIDVELRAYGSNVEKLFLINPGGNVDDIKLGFEGVNSLLVADNGELLLETEVGTVSMSAPVAYQYIDGNKKDVQVSYKISGTDYGFILESYDANYQLVIDPLLASTFIGGSGRDQANSIAIDSTGRIFVAGSTRDDTTDYPTTTGAYDESQNGFNDVFVSRLDADLSDLQASTFIGGSEDDFANAIAIDSTDRIYVVGFTQDSTTDYPTTTGAWDETQNGGRDAFVSRLDADLSDLQASTLLGGSGTDSANGIAINTNGGIYVTGQTQDSATDLPTTTGAWDEIHNGDQDVFVSRFDADLTDLEKSTYIGGSSFDIASAIAIDSTERIFVAGLTQDSGVDYPTTNGAYDEIHNGGNDAFVSRLDADLSDLQASTLIGGLATDRARGIAIDSTDRIYVIGRTASTGFPAQAGAWDGSHNGSDDVFVSRFATNLNDLQVSTFLGGSSIDHGSAIAIDSIGRIFVTGFTSSDETTFPITGGAFDEIHNGARDVFVSRFNADLSLVQRSTFIGGSFSEEANSIAIDSTNRIYVTGFTSGGMPSYPTSLSAYDQTHNGSDDVFVTHFEPELLGIAFCGIFDVTPFNEIEGTSGADIIEGTAGDDIIFGHEGDDIINGNGGNDIILGGKGNDTIQGNAGADCIDGGLDNDEINGNKGDDSINGNLGDDFVNGGQGTDLIFGGEGNDMLLGFKGVDTINGGAGDDAIDGQGNNDVLSGGDDNDVIHGGGGADIINGDAGNDALAGGGGDDDLNGGTGDDRLAGEGGSDDFDGGAGVNNCATEPSDGTIVNCTT